jgi:hypothetical protein
LLLVFDGHLLFQGLFKTLLVARLRRAGTANPQR